MVAVENAEKLRRRVESRVGRFMDEQGLWPPDGRVLVAVSGGQDSTALLLVLSRLAARRRLQLVVAHFDHGLRGLDVAERETEVVRALAASLGLRFLSGRGDTGARAKRDGLSLEDAARRERYEFLASAAREAGCSAVATGHTASDQAETVLMHMLRGAGLTGLSGMAPKSDWPVGVEPQLTLVRPLLELSRDETAAYCRAAGAQTVEDESNASMLFLRNRLRHELMPVLREYNPRIEAALVRLSEAAREDASYLESAARDALRFENGVVSMQRDLLSELPPAVRRQVLREGLRTLLGDGREFGARHFAALERLVLRGRTGDRLDLPRGITARLGRDVLELRAGEIETEALPAEPVIVCVPGEARFGRLHIVAGHNRLPEATSVQVDASAVGESIVVRRRRAGDRMQPAGMTGTKKLQDLFVDAHVARELRDTVPVFEAARGIVWVGGLRVAEWAKPRPDAPVLFLSYRVDS